MKWVSLALFTFAIIGSFLYLSKPLPASIDSFTAQEISELAESFEKIAEIRYK